MCRPWLKCYPTQTTQMLKVQTYRNIQIDTDVLCSSTLLGHRGWLRWESIKGMLCDWGGRLFVFCCYPDSAQSQKGSMQPKGRLMCQIPPSPFFFLSPLGIWRSGIPQSEQRLILPPPRDRACFSRRVIWDFQRGSGGEGRGGHCAVGLVLVEMTGWWCGDRQDWLELRKKCKTETDGKAGACSLRLKGLARCLIPTILSPETTLWPTGVAFGQVALVRIDLLSSNADWY